MKFIFLIFFSIFNIVFCEAQNLSIDTSFLRDNISSINFRNNGKLYKVVSYNEDKTKYSECDYKDESINGKCKWFYPDGSVKASCMYVDNVKEGEYILFYKSGKIELSCKYKNGSLNGPYTTFYESGERYSECIYINGNLYGGINYYNKAGNKFLFQNLKNNKLHGIVTYYYENGQVQYTGEYKNGKMHGERLCYDEKGNFLNGKVITPLYGKNAYREGTYINGRPDGELKIYTDSVLVLLANFKNGKPDGLTHYYDRNAQDSIVDLYKNGKFVKEIKLSK